MQLEQSRSNDQRSAAAWTNPHGAEGYLVDYYQVLGVERTADEDTIKSAYRQLMKQYHPDLLEQLGDSCPPEFKLIAKKRSDLYSSAYEVLSDADKKPAYDSYLASWKGPVSKDGIPVISLFSKNFSALSLLADPTKRDAEIETYCKQALAMCGFSPEIHALLQKEVSENTDCSEALKAAYADSLEKQEIYLALQQNRIEEELGISNKNLGILPEKLLETAEENLRQVHARLPEELTAGLLTVAEGRLQLGGARGEQISAELTQQREIALGQLQAQALEAAEQLSSRIQAIAASREGIVEQRLALLKPTYDPIPATYSDRLLVVLKLSPEDAGILFSASVEILADEDKWTLSEPPPEISLDKLAHSTECAQLTEQGWNIIKFQIDSLPHRRVLTRLLSLHAANYRSSKGVQP